jgi:hypothetical protein
MGSQLGGAVSIATICNYVAINSIVGFSMVNSDDFCDYSHSIGNIGKSSDLV